MVVEAIRFDMSAGTLQRKSLIYDLNEWLREHIGAGRIMIEGVDELSDAYDWYILTANDYIKVLLTKERDTTIFMLRWG